jgi:hypothetical protein
MIAALGYSQTPFSPHKPGRLCRGRERWIEPWEAEESERMQLHRLMISGAAFSDESAADARRGVPHSGVSLANVIAALFPRKTMVAWMEDGHPADIPEDAVGIEAYEGYRDGGRSALGLVRWHMKLSGVGALRELLGEGLSPDEKVRGLVVLDGEVDEEELAQRLFAFSGFSTLDSPPARYQPLALGPILDLVKAVVLLHRDKHGPALGIYVDEPIEGHEAKLAKLCDKAGALLVPFAIPPMLARWDRALHELRSDWMETRDEEWPVPAAPEGAGWNSRDRRGRRRGKKKETSEE